MGTAFQKSASAPRSWSTDTQTSQIQKGSDLHRIEEPLIKRDRLKSAPVKETWSKPKTINGQETRSPQSECSYTSNSTQIFPGSITCFTHIAIPWKSFDENIRNRSSREETSVKLKSCHRLTGGHPGYSKVNLSAQQRHSVAESSTERIFDKNLSNHEKCSRWLQVRFENGR